MLDQIPPRGMAFFLIGLLGGFGAILLNIKTEEPGFMRNPDFWRKMLVETLVVITVGAPVALMVGMYMDDIGMQNAALLVAYLTAVTAKDIVKNTASDVLPNLLRAITRGSGR